MFKKILVVSITFLATFYLSACSDKQSSVPPEQEKVQAGINQILSQVNEPILVGIKVQSMQDGTVLFAKNADNAFMPASNFKLFTALAALLYLGPNYQYQTVLLTDAKSIQNGVLDGNIYLKFSGDPSLKSAQLKQLLANLHQQGITKITGNFYLDTSIYDNKAYGKGWMADDMKFCFAAPLSAMIINHNCVAYNLAPTTTGNLANLQPMDNEKIIPVKNAVVTHNAGAACDLEGKVDDNNFISVSGCIPEKANALNLYFAVKNPEIYTTALIQQLLMNNQIYLQGQIRNGIASNNLTIMATHNSKPLRLLVDKMLKESDNMIANTLLKTLGANYFKQQGTWENGVKAVQAILGKEPQINFDKSTFVDGDGQSRYDLVTPNQISQLLYFAYKDFNISPEFITALPVAGSDGTLDKRLLNQHVLVRAKTGTMTGVSSLSGYIETKDHQILSFVILTNNYAGPEENLTKLQDQICQFLATI